jgi:hypothetical protein
LLLATLSIALASVSMATAKRERKSMNFFQRHFGRTTDEEAAQRDADARGVKVVHADVDERALISEHDAAVRQAYERGRRDERSRGPRHRGSPFLTTVLVLAACAGAFVIYLGVSQGSFANGGQAIDQNLANAKAQAAQASRNVAARAGDALQNAGQKLKQPSGNS